MTPQRRSPPASIAALVGVKDEVDLIGPCMRHLRRIGVDRIVVVDYGSTDGTLDVVATEARNGDVAVAHIDPDVVVDYASSSAHDLAQVDATDADWVVVIDADEFWIPASGSLRTCESLNTADVVIAERFNVALTAHHLLMPCDLSPSHYDSLQLLARRVPHFQDFIEQHPLEPLITIAPGAKVAARRAVIRQLSPGGHDVVADDTARRAVADDLVVAHVAFSSVQRFAMKVANIRQELARHPALFENGMAWHWRRWAMMTGPAALEAEFARQVASLKTLEEWRRLGYLRTASELFAARQRQTLPAEAAVRAAWDFSARSSLRGIDAAGAIG